MQRSLAKRVKEQAYELGFDLAGIARAGPALHSAEVADWLAHGYQGEMAYMARNAEARGDPRWNDPDILSVVALATRYPAPHVPAVLRSDPARGRIAAYAWGPDYHDWIRPRLFALDAFLRQETGRAALGRCYVDTGPVLERDWAMQAGLGFIGRNTCLIHPEMGSWLLLSVLLVPEELDPDPLPLLISPPSSYPGARHPSWRLPDGRIGTCGACTRCLDACPTQAFVAPYVLDARRCISYLTIELRGAIPHDLRPQIENWIFGCDACQRVCPWSNRRALSPSSPADLVRWMPSLLDLLALDEAGFRQRFRGTPIQRAKRRGLLRNVCVAIGNWGERAAVPALTLALHDKEPLIRGHAAWALGQIGGARARDELSRAQAEEVDEAVRAELHCALQM